MPVSDVLPAEGKQVLRMLAHKLVKIGDVFGPSGVYFSGSLNDNSGKAHPGKSVLNTRPVQIVRR